MKKSLSLILALAMVFTMFASVVSADTAPAAGTTVTAATYTPQQAFDFLKGAGIVEGDSVKGADLDGNLTRAQFAKVITKLWALPEAPEGSTVYSDLSGAGWAAGYIGAATKAGLLNGVGGGKFNPSGNVKLEEIAKVVATGFKLTSVDYAGTGKVSTWAKGYVGAVIAKKLVADSADFTKAAKRGEIFTIGYTGYVTIENSKVPPTPTPTPTPVGAALSIVSADSTTNTKVAVSLKDAVKSVTAADFSIKGADAAALAVTSASLSTDGLTATLVTAAQKTGAVYTLTANGVSVTFVGAVVDTTVPTVDMVVGKANKTVEVTFSEKVDAATALVAANYTSDNDLTFTAAVVGDDSTKVLLTSSAQVAGKLYTLTVKNVTDLSGNKTADTAKKFGGIGPDTTKPTISTAVSSDGIKVEVTFAETGMLETTSALNPANYTIEGLTVTAAKFKQDADKKDINKLGVNPVVVLTTSGQTSGKLYTLKVSNVADGSANVIEAASAKSFGGTPLDTVKLSLTSAVATTNTSVELTFDDNVDATTGAVATNYTISDGVTVSKAVVADNKVTLTTSTQVGGKLYTVTVANVLDDTANVLDVKEKKFGGVAPDTTKPTITRATGINKNSVEILFAEKVTKAVANKAANYNIGTLGYATKATLKDDGVTVVLTTATQTTGKTYEIIVNNITDLSGNVIASDSKVSFGGIGDALSKLQVVGATMFDKNTVKVFLNQAVSTVAASNFKIEESGNASPVSGSIAGGLSIATKSTPNAPVASIVGDNKDEVLLTFASTYASDSGKVYTVTISGITGKYGAVIDTDKKAADFGGVSNAKADLKVDVAQATDNQTVVFTFNADLSGVPTASAFKLYKVEALTGTAITGTSATLSGNKVTVVFNNTLESNTVYYLDIATGNAVKDVSGLYDAKIDNAAGVSEAVFASAALSAPSLEVTGAVMTDESTLNIYFNRNIDAGVANAFDANGVVTIKDTASTPNTVVSGAEFKSVEKTADNVLTVYFVDAGTGVSKLVAGGVYSVELTASLNVRLVGNTAITLANQSDAAKRKAEFAAVLTEKAQPSIASVTTVSYNKVLVTMTEGLDGVLTNNTPTTLVKIYNGTVQVDPSSLTVVGTDNKVFEITIANGQFATGTSYTVVLGSANTLKDFASIKNVKVQATATGTENSATFSGAGSLPTSVSANITPGTTTVGAAGAATVGATVKVVADGALSSATAVGTTPTVAGDGSFTVTGLTAATSYDLYVIDSAGNVSAKLDIATP